MAPPSSGEGLPRLGYVVHPGSFSTFALVEAARGVCELIWITDSSELDPTECRLLARTGTAVDVAGLDASTTAELIAREQLNGVLALADDKLRWTAALAERLSLDFHSVATATALTDKLAQRRCFREAGLPTPQSWAISDADDLSTLEAELTFPLVLKPRIGEASRDTILVATLDELRQGITRFSDPSRRREFTIEAYIPDASTPLGGHEFAGYVSVESCVDAGRFRHLAITGRLPPAYPFRETGFFIPAAIDDSLREIVLSAAATAAAALGVRTGCQHIEVKLTDAGPVVIEVNGRIGGGVPEMLEAVAHINFLTVAMRLALGQRSGLPAHLPMDGLAYLFYLQAPATIHEVTRVEGLESIRAYPGVDEVALRNGPGSHIDWRQGNHGHVASVLGTARDHDELRRVYTYVTDTIEIAGA